MQRIRNLGAVLTMLLIGGLIGATDGRAQACRGIPTADGQINFQGVLGLTAETIQYGGGADANLAGPLSLGAGYTRTNFEDFEILLLVFARTDNTLFGDLAYEIPGLALSMCPKAEIRYSWGSEDPVRRLPGNTILVAVRRRSFSRLVIPIGLGVGKTLPTGLPVSVTFFAEPRVMFVRGKVKNRDLFLRTIGFDETDTSAEFGAVLGAVLSTHRVFGGGDVSVSTLEDTDLVVSLRAGVIF